MREIGDKIMGLIKIIGQDQTSIGVRVTTGGIRLLCEDCLKKRDPYNNELVARVEQKNCDICGTEKVVRDE